MFKMFTTKLIYKSNFSFMNWYLRTESHLSCFHTTQAKAGDQTKDKYMENIDLIYIKDGFVVDQRLRFVSVA